MPDPAVRRLIHATVLAEPGVVVPDAAVTIGSDGMVDAIGPFDGVKRSGDLDVAGRVVMPGMTNAHTHSAMTLLRGLLRRCPAAHLVDAHT